MSVSFPQHLLKIKSFAMYRCSVELSVRYDEQSQSQSEHAGLIHEHTFDSVANRFDLCFEHYILNIGFASVIRLINTLL